MGFPRLKPTCLAWQVESFHWDPREGHDKPRQHILKSRDITLPTKVCTTSQSCYFSSSYVQIWELDHKEAWVPKNWYFCTVVLEKTLESPWTASISNQSILKEINPEYPAVSCPRPSYFKTMAEENEKWLLTVWPQYSLDSKENKLKVFGNCSTKRKCFSPPMPRDHGSQGHLSRPSLIPEIEEGEKKTGKEAFKMFYLF